MYIGGVAIGAWARTQPQLISTWSTAHGFVGAEVRSLLILIGTIAACGVAVATAAVTWGIGELKNGLALTSHRSQRAQLLGVVGGISLFVIALLLIQP